MTCEGCIYFWKQQHANDTEKWDSYTCCYDIKLESLGNLPDRLRCHHFTSKEDSKTGYGKEWN